MRDQIVKSTRLRIHQVQILSMNDLMIFSDNTSHGDISSDGWKKWLGKPIYQDLVQNLGFNRSSPTSPFMNMIKYMCGDGLPKRGQNLSTGFIPNRQLEMCQK
jgi:hypothetical protein